MATAKYAMPITNLFGLVLATVREVGVTVSGVTKDVRGGPCTLKRVLVCNNDTGATATRVSCKIYDDISSSLVAGTSLPVLVIPVEADESTIVTIDPGLTFENGISVLCAKSVAGASDGTTCTAAPDSDVTVQFLTT